MTTPYLSQHVTLDRLNDLDVLRIQNKQASASIAIQGAHLFEYTPANKTNLLFVSDAETFEQGQPIRGGIPVCWPWFGAHSTLSDAPAHGLVRTALWSYDIVADSDDRTDVRFYLETQGGDEGFPYRARVELLISIGQTLVLSLTTHNLDDKPFLISQALHTYYACDHIDDVRLHGLAGACYQDKVNGDNAYIPTQFRFDREVDWVVQEPGKTVGFTGLGSYGIQLNRIGSRSLVLWNPWIEKSQGLSHFRPDEYQRMFCVETGNVSEDSRLVKAKQSHAMVMEVSDIEIH